MTLLELSQEYAYSAELIARRMVQLRQGERQAEDEAVRFALHRRILDLDPMLRQCRQVYRLTAHYYDRSYHKDEKISL